MPRCWFASTGGLELGRGMRRAYPVSVAAEQWGLHLACESVTVHLSERKAWLITVSWPRSEHVCWGDPQAKREGGRRRGGRARLTQIALIKKNKKKKNKEDADG